MPVDKVPLQKEVWVLHAAGLRALPAHSCAVLGQLLGSQGRRASQDHVRWVFNFILPNYYISNQVIL